jgi:hypothetical protein
MYFGIFNALNTKKKTTTYDDGNPGPALGHAQRYGGVKPVKSGFLLSPVENWIINSNTFINKEVIRSHKSKIPKR